MYKAESVLGLVASIISVLSAAISLAGSLIVIIFSNTFEPALHKIFNSHLLTYGFDYNTVAKFISGVFIFYLIVAFIIATASFILGFIGTYKLKNDKRSGGVLLIIAGVLALISVFEFVPFVLFLVAGIMTVSKKPQLT